MQIKIGETIARLRRARGITQEQLAEAIGVSAPAVSKWETGQSYPDITLLPPLARFFYISTDALLAYEPSLTDGGRDAAVDEVNALFDTEGWDAGLAGCDKLLREHPGDAKLRVALASCLMRGAIYAQPGEQREACKAKQEAWLKQALSMDDGEAKPYAKYMLSALYLGQKRLDDADAMLSSLGDTPLNPQHLLPTLRRLQGRDDEAEKLSLQNLRAAMGDAVNNLLALVSLSVKADDPARAKTLAEMAEAIVTPLGLEHLYGFSIANGLLTAAHAANDSAAMLCATERLAYAVLRPGTPCGGALFSALQSGEPISPAHHLALRTMLANDFADSEYFSPIRSDPRFAALLDRLRDENA